MLIPKTTRPETHEISWEAEREVHVAFCRVIMRPVDFTVAALQQKPTICPGCGHRLWLAWEVRLDDWDQLPAWVAFTVEVDHTEEPPVEEEVEAVDDERGALSGVW